MNPLTAVEAITLSVVSVSSSRRVEGVSLTVVGTDDESLALQAAPILADRLYPGREWGDVLWSEGHEGWWEVVLEDRGRRHVRNPLGRDYRER